MSNGEMPAQASEAPKTHTLRVAIFDFYEDTLVTRYGGPPLFRDVQELNEHGLVGIDHEHRAKLVTSRQLMGQLGLKALGGRLSVEDHEGNSHDAYATMTLVPTPYKFFREAMSRGMLARRNSLDSIYEKVDNSLKLHGVEVKGLPEAAREPFNQALEEADKAFDPVDALILDKARHTFDALKHYRS